MTGHSTLQGQIVAVGSYVVLLGGIIGYGIRAHLRDRRSLVTLARAAEAQRRTAAVRQTHERALLATVPSRIPPRRLPSFETCEDIWAETLALWNLEPDVDLLDEWEQSR